MGLDMYFNAKCTSYKSYFNGDKEEKRFDYPEDLKVAQDYITERNFMFQEAETTYAIGYFRKFNALHSYIVQNFANGVDDCRDIVLTKENILELLNICSQIKRNHSKASELLPTTGGFFFGSLDYDEWYFKDVKEAVKLFKMILDSIDLEKYTIVYNASW